MNDTSTLPAPSVEPSALRSAKWERERSAFRAILPQLLSTHRGQFVAIHNGQIAANGPVKLDVALAALAKIGNEDIYVGLVSDQAESPVRSGVRRDVSAGAFS